MILTEGFYWDMDDVSHKFKVGDLVAINPAISRFVPGGVFAVIKQLPEGS